jgi:hypothetical protein
MSEIETVFPGDVDIIIAKNALAAIRKANPKIPIKIWKSFIVDKYNVEIEAGDIYFFIGKDYDEDLTDVKHSEKITSAINRLREPIKRMSETNQAMAMKYIQNLTRISVIYSSEQA